MHDLHGGTAVNLDEKWALSRLVDNPSLQECSSARVTIGKVTHRALREVPGYPGWRTLCGLRLICFVGRTFVVSGSRQGYGVSVADVDCLCCIPAGG